MTITTVKPEITQFATQMYEEQQQYIRQNYIDSLAHRIQESLDQSEGEIERGEFMDMSTFKERLYAIDLSE